MLIITSVFIKLVSHIVKILGFGSGLTLPGYLLIKLFPNVIHILKVTYPMGVILVTGTNGKTTTTKLITHFLENQNIKVCTNKSGANLISGILTSLLLDVSTFGMYRSHIGVFEIDEFSLPKVIKFLDPHTIVMTNLSRDQLDRYGEVDIVLEKWVSSIDNLKVKPMLVLPLHDTSFNTFKNLNFPISWFEYDEALLKGTSLRGKFNAMNVSAALKVLSLLGYPEIVCRPFLKTFSYAYGRGEVLEYQNTTYTVYLAKNPASFNHNLDFLSHYHSDISHVLFILNDGIPDGRDVSWIYDIDTSLLHSFCEGKKVFVSGNRSLDMCVRLKYAGVNVNNYHITNSENAAVNLISKYQEENEINNLSVLVLPNYSAMLAVREILTGRKIL